MSGLGSGGMGSGDRKRGGMGGKSGGGDAPPGRRDEGGVMLRQDPLEAHLAPGDTASGAGQAGGLSPAPSYEWRSGASEHDEFFYPGRGRDAPRRAAPAPALAAPSSAGPRSSGSRAAHTPASAEKRPRRQGTEADTMTRAKEAIRKAQGQSLVTAGKLLDNIAVLQGENQARAAALAEKDKILSDKEEMIQSLSAQLAAAMSRLQAKESTTASQQEQLQFPGTPAASRPPIPGIDMSTGPLNVVPREHDGEETPLPTRPRGLTPTASTFRPIPNQKRALTITPKSADDVFAAGFTSPAPGQQFQGTPDSAKKTIPELLSGCLTKIETAVRKVSVRDLVPEEREPSAGDQMQRYQRPSRDQYQIIRLLQDHLGVKKLAYEILKDKEGRVWAMIALLSHTIVDYIFQEQIMGTNNSFVGQAYLAAFTEEQKAAIHGHPRISDIQYRHSLAEQRASSAKTLVRQPGFWKWIQSTTYVATENIVRDFAVCFPAHQHYGLTQDLHRAVGEAVRLAVRMRQEPTLPEFTFPPAGTPWNSLFHVHRNPELMGQTLGDERSPYCVRIAIMPLIKEKSFANNTVTMETLNKAEVVVGDRDTLLRQTRRQH